MKRKLEQVRTIDLGYEQMLMFDSGPGTRVRVLYGATWLTEPGVARDAFLGAGAEHGLRAGGGALIQGLAPSRVQILEVGREGWWRRAWSGLLRRYRAHRAHSQFGPEISCANCA